MNAPERSVPLPERLPVIPLWSTLVYPGGVIAVQLGLPATLQLLDAHPTDPLTAALVIAPGEPDAPVELKSLEKAAVAVRLSDRIQMPGGTVQATLAGVARIRLTAVREEHGYYSARVAKEEELPVDEQTGQDLIARTLTAIEALAGEIDRISPEVPRILRMNVGDPGRFADLVATLANFGAASKDEVLARSDVRARLEYVLQEIEGQFGRAQRSHESDGLAPQAGTRRSRDAPPAGPERSSQLRRQIQKLQVELGEIDPLEREATALLARIEGADLPTQVASHARMEIERMRTLSPNSLEVGDIRIYIDTLLCVPWARGSTQGAQAIELPAVQAALDAALIRLEEPKERLLDYLAVAKLRSDLRGPIPCLVGPADVGKTTLAAALAKGLGRPLARLELGGRGEAQIVGTRRTRPGAQPGKIAAALCEAKARDPVFLLEEMDEIGLGKVEGDPIEAMEEALGWPSRAAFVDRYLDLPLDLRDSMFIATAVNFFRVPRGLRELMVEIRIAGYTPEEKMEIARKRLMPRMLSEHGLGEEDVEFTDEALFFLANGYARDAGMGALERSLATLLRTRARAKADAAGAAPAGAPADPPGTSVTEVASSTPADAAQAAASATGAAAGRWTFTPERIELILGPPRYVATIAESAPEVGVVAGLAWTPSGGELMFIEALRMPGSGRLIITGMLGDVMRESVNAAYSYVRSRGEALRITEEIFRDSDIHVHFPVGAIPKDGPSAGVAVTLAVASSLSNRPVRHDVAMTGEVTLRGKILEVGGIKEKVHAAYRAGMLEVILPKGNQRDLRELPADVREKMRFHFVERMDQVIDLALQEAPVVEEGGAIGELVTVQPAQDAHRLAAADSGHD